LRRRREGRTRVDVLKSLAGCTTGADCTTGAVTTGTGPERVRAFQTQTLQVPGLADRTLRLAVVRFVFTAYLLLITAGLAFYIAIGITNPQ
jgi:hypothetical protein